MRDEIESVIRCLCDKGEYDRAATRAIETYGPEVARFFSGRIKNKADAQDIFGMFCEDFWQGLPGFAWRCTLRGWVYTIARHSELRYLSAPPRRQDRMVTLSETNAVATARTSTAPFARTDVRNRFREIRERLGEEDQLILVLRVDRALGWRDIAYVLATSTAPAADELQREEARIRKRFQLIKERLRRWAADDGLLPETGTA